MGQTFHFEQGIRLLGYDVPKRELTSGEVLPLRLYWEADGPTDESYHVFAHAMGPDGRMYGQDDAVPQEGAMPTVHWQARDLVVDDYRIPISENAPPGEYTIALGMYDRETMQRLPVSDATGEALPENRILIEGVRVVSND
jgi:hypothetical protein